jgi:rhodanese-related sulfurtransferase
MTDKSPTVALWEGGLDRGGYRDVTVADVARLATEVRIVDVREPHEFTGELGHLDRAELVPLGTIGQEHSKWSKESPILMVCRSGGRSGQASAALARAGFTQVMNMAGGMLAWNQK